MSSSEMVLLLVEREGVRSWAVFKGDRCISNSLWPPVKGDIYGMFTFYGIVIHRFSCLNLSCYIIGMDDSWSTRIGGLVLHDCRIYSNKSTEFLIVLFLDLFSFLNFLSTRNLLSCNVPSYLFSMTLPRQKIHLKFSSYDVKNIWQDISHITKIIQ